MILMIDWGNSLLKFIEIENLAKESIYSAKLGKVDNLKALQQKLSDEYDNVLISSVRSAKDNERLKLLLTGKSNNILFATTSTTQCGITCAYPQPSSLGVDRWLGILAAGNDSDSVGIISIGTAITIDVVVDRKHLGGQILPGKDLMFTSLLQTGQVRAKQKQPLAEMSLLGKNTSDCVNFAVNTAIQGYLQTVINLIDQRYSVKNWVVTGGGVEAINKLTKANNRILNIRHLLVFEGLMNFYNQ